ncbi:hypothetical protein C8A05DRAFT_47889 [Staphylotrichum tortipilum]|uniref:Response regulatory domain-containing protein n=1 Tax=Staphylotrichum tortipilum TaxID=2831512 RepID=A0AAN6MBW5_9PEZI|nr:hypothetical protein C8A05DRAFT_47889 [Staphylotrichum longicolle]
MGSSQSVTSSASSIQERPEWTESPAARPVTPCCREEPKVRVSFGAAAGTFVQGFPSKGGVYMLSCSAMELEFLGLDLFETALPSADPAEEDSLCARMRLLGPEWWPSLEAYKHAWGQEFQNRGRGCMQQHQEERVRFFAVASQGGVWVLEAGEEECSSRQLGRINNARDMEEKCRQIEKFGGTFYPAPGDCPLLDFKSPFPERAMVHVLLADGDASNREVTRSLMAELGFSSIAVVMDGKEALSLLLAAAEDKTQRKPDILVANTELPIIDAFECARLLRTDFNYSQHYSHIPIVLMPHRTLLGDNNLGEKSAMMSGFVPRPIQKEQLERTLVQYTLKGPRRFLLSGPSVEDARRDARVIRLER